MKHSYLLILFLFAFGGSALASGPLDWLKRNASDTGFDDKRIVQRSFAVTTKSTLEVENMYGDITINAWEKDSVRAQVTVTAWSDDLSDLRQMLQDIEVRIEKSSTFIIVSSDWSKEVGVFRKGVYDIQRNLGGSKRVTIDVQLWMPSYLELEINNRFGDVFMGDHEGKIDIELSHGDLRAHNIRSPGKIKMSYGKLDINKFGSGRLDLSYCENASIEKAGELSLTSSSSEVEIEEVDELRLDSRHDEITVHSAGRITGTQFLTDLRVENLTTMIDLNTRMGEVRIRRVKPGVSTVSFTSTNTDILIDLDPMFTGGMRLELDNVKDLSLDVDDLEIIEDTSNETSRRLTAHVGGDDQPVVRVTARNGYLRISRQ